MTWLHFLFVQSVFVFVGQTLSMGLTLAVRLDELQITGRAAHLSLTH
jgi:hypothetical protein